MVLSVSPHSQRDAITVIAVEVQVCMKLGNGHVLGHSIEFDDDIVFLNASLFCVVAPDKSDEHGQAPGGNAMLLAVVFTELVPPEAAIWTRHVQGFAPGRIGRAAP